MGIQVSAPFFFFLYSLFFLPLKTVEAANALPIPTLRVLEDPQRSFTPAEAAHAKFAPCTQAVPSFGFYNGAVWFTFSVPPAQSSNTLWLELKNPNLDDISLFRLPQGDGPPLLLVHTGDWFDFSSRPVHQQMYRLPLQALQGTESRYLLRINNHGDQFFIPMQLGTPQEISASDYSSQLINGGYFGLLGFVILLNLFMVGVIRDNTNLYYLLYLLSFLFLQLALSGYAFRHLWPHSGEWNNRSLPFFASVSVMCISLFSMRFLQLRERLPRYYTFFRIITVLIFLNIILSLLPGFACYRWSVLLINVYTLALNLSIMPGAIAVYRMQYKPARFYLLAFMVLVVGVFLFVFRNFGLVPSNLFTNYSLQIGSSFEVILLTFAVIDKFKSFRDEALEKATEISELRSRQNVMLETQVKERTAEIEEQKLRIEEKNRSIVDSINYALRIQQAILPPARVVQELLPRSFVLYLPKDIVAGDFYWIDSCEEHIYVAVCDCTGHGVPGAMVSVVCNTALNRSLNEFGLRVPGEIFDKTRELVLENFARSDREVKDGMDASLCVFHPSAGTLQWAGANHSLWVYRAATSEMQEVKGDKQPIGKTDRPLLFSTHTLQLKSGDAVYLFTDGFADQFGGDKGKKLTKTKFREFLVSIAPLEMEQQKEKLFAFHERYKGNNEQVDDICIVGVRV